MTIRAATLLCLVGVIGCGPDAATAPPVAASIPEGRLSVSVSGREIVLSPKLWRPMVDEAAYARNFEAVSNTPPRQYQILTVFLNQMTDERRQGRAIAPNEVS